MDGAVEPPPKKSLHTRAHTSVKAMRDLLVSNGILTTEGKLNMETAKRLGWTVNEGELASGAGTLEYSPITIQVL